MAVVCDCNVIKIINEIIRRQDPIRDLRFSVIFYSNYTLQFEERETQIGGTHTI